ncbi:Nif3-like dinuclear metal center hexameric protein [Lactococcus nasutitermitis]|uniref:GTP cyclohydrolase 1 type 2 homolog n=1 Tax=Lactococcus nasutitermitis TaxID=1652957 RepID=A0ABV9JDP0_9LACT|nr:Nif3-like dinuclear metal center hexameric protein [Lactococcus nasutitermitis]
MKISEFISYYEAFCPKELSLENDPVGLQIGSPDAILEKVLVTLDIREQTVEEAIEKGVQLILAKHPIIFHPLTSITTSDSQEKLLLKLISAGISVYTSHTNIDIVQNGLNDWFCELLDITNTKILDTKTGLGRIGSIPTTRLSDFSEKVRTAFGLEHLRIVAYNHDLNQEIHRVAICGGSGGKFWQQAKEKDADLYITGDIYYHTAHDLLSSGMVALDPGHYIEHLFVPKIAEKLRQFTPEIQIIESQQSTNPFYDI